MEIPKIVVVGSSNTDMVIKMEKLPKPGETIIGGKFIMAAGGKGANQAVAAARLGGEVTFVARVGTDIFGKQAINGFQKEGIVTDYIVKDGENPSGVALIFVDQRGENSIAVASGANGQLSRDNVETARNEIAGAHVLLLQLEIPMETVQFAVFMASELGKKVILNPAPARELDDSLLHSLSVITPNESETEILTGIEVRDERSAEKAAEVLRKKGVQNVIITMGSQGSFLYSDSQVAMIPTRTIEAVDTTAAGDAFNGALAYSIAKGDPLDDAVRFANTVGAFSATKLGAQPSMPTTNELQEFSRS